MDMNPEDQQDPSQPADDSAEPVPAAPETPESESAPETPEGEAAPEAEQQLPRSEAALAEMRRVLREEEKTQAPTGFRAALKRITGKLRGRKPKPGEEEETEAPSRLDELQFPQAPAAPPAVEQAPTEEAAAPEEGAPSGQAPETEFGSMVRDRLTGALAQREELQPVPHEETPELIEEPEPVGPGGRKGGILAAIRPEDQASQEELSTLRQEALEDYQAPTEEEDESHASLGGRLRRSWRFMRPMERRLLIGALVIVGLAMIGGSGFLVVQSIPTPTPVPTPTTSITPIPISISLPGGWVFPLSVGRVDPDGVWRPKGAEWLGGTEVCRWVSLPWTVQLEAVLRTLNANDEIKLSMSNYDSLIYKVQAIEQMPASQINKLAADTPCLLVILSQQGTDSRWVVKAKP